MTLNERQAGEMRTLLLRIEKTHDDLKTKNLTRRIKLILNKAERAQTRDRQ